MKQPRLYRDLADWWPLLQDSADYQEEAAIYYAALVSHARNTLSTILELGSGGGNNAYHLKKYFHMTLVDLSERMLAVSERQNPECNHVQGDMRSVRLGKIFDAVFIHDAIVYMSTRKQLREAMETASIHCRSGGLALFVPDWTADNFTPCTSHGGHDRGDRGLRYLSWIIDEDPEDEQYIEYMVYVLKEKHRIRQTAIDEHVCGLFPEAVWLQTIRESGFRPIKLPFDHSELQKGKHFLYMGVKE